MKFIIFAMLVWSRSKINQKESSGMISDYKVKFRPMTIT